MAASQPDVALTASFHLPFVGPPVSPARLGQACVPPLTMSMMATSKKGKLCSPLEQRRRKAVPALEPSIGGRALVARGHGQHHTPTYDSPHKSSGGDLQTPPQQQPGQLPRLHPLADWSNLPSNCQSAPLPWTLPHATNDIYALYVQYYVSPPL